MANEAISYAYALQRLALGSQEGRVFVGCSADEGAFAMQCSVADLVTHIRATHGDSPEPCRLLSPAGVLYAIVDVLHGEGETAEGGPFTLLLALSDGAAA